MYAARRRPQEFLPGYSMRFSFGPEDPLGGQMLV